MKKVLFKLLIILSLISFNSISAYAASARGLATTYKLTITKMELCEKGSTAASCLNPITVSLPGIGTLLDIAAVTAGETAGTIGNFGLATAGTGDILTGIITGIIAQGFDPLQACLFGVYLHGKSADLLIEDIGYQSLIASHVLEGISLAYLDLFKEPEGPEVEHVDEEEN